MGADSLKQEGVGCLMLLIGFLNVRDTRPRSMPRKSYAYPAHRLRTGIAHFGAAAAVPRFDSNRAPLHRVRRHYGLAALVSGRLNISNQAQAASGDRVGLG
jgi:hypothetical protein